MLALEQIILKDAATVGQPVWLVTLGDMIDRGPSSAGVIDHLIAPPPDGITRICLGGNHEAMLLDYLGGQMDSRWLELGGYQTLTSYGIDMPTFLKLSPRRRHAVLASHIPTDHLEFFRNLTLTAALPGAVLVHAGLRHGVALADQSPDDLIWLRDTNDEQPWQPGWVVVHGHTPASEPVVLPHRICVDTGAFATGRLTAVKLTAHAQPEIFFTDNQLR